MDDFDQLDKELEDNSILAEPISQEELVDIQQCVENIISQIEDQYDDGGKSNGLGPDWENFVGSGYQNYPNESDQRMDSEPYDLISAAEENQGEPLNTLDTNADTIENSAGQMNFESNPGDVFFGEEAEQISAIGQVELANVFTDEERNIKVDSELASEEREKLSRQGSRPEAVERPIFIESDELIATPPTSFGENDHFSTLGGQPTFDDTINSDSELEVPSIDSVQGEFFKDDNTEDISMNDILDELSPTSGEIKVLKNHHSSNSQTSSLDAVGELASTEATARPDAVERPIIAADDVFPSRNEFGGFVFGGVPDDEDFSDDETKHFRNDRNSLSSSNYSPINRVGKVSPKITKLKVKSKGSKIDPDQPYINHIKDTDKQERPTAVDRPILVSSTVFPTKDDLRSDDVVSIVPLPDSRELESEVSSLALSTPQRESRRVAAPKKRTAQKGKKSPRQFKSRLPKLQNKGYGSPGNTKPSHPSAFYLPQIKTKVEHHNLGYEEILEKEMELRGIQRKKPFR